ncbi:MAG: alpha/beta hydrolase [Bacteroidales bacterium]
MESFITSNDIPVHISDNNKEGEVLLLLHGYLETLYIWNEFIELLPGYRIITMDLPGHGLTGSNSDITSLDFIANVIEGVLDKCGVEKCSIIGHSLGGFVAQTCVRVIPDRVNKIICLNSSPFPDPLARNKARKREINLIEDSKLLQLASISIPNMYFKSNLRKCDDKIQETIEICETHNPDGIISILKGLLDRPDNIEVLRDSNIPLLFIYGDSERLLPKGGIVLLKKELPLSTVNIIANIGHNSFIEAPEETARLVLEFIES